MTKSLAIIWLLFSVVFSTTSFHASALNAENSIAVVVHSDSAVQSLSKAEVIDLFMGRFTETSDGEVLIPLDYKSELNLKGEFYQTLVNRSLRQVNSYWSRLLFSGRAKAQVQVNSVANLGELFNGNQHYIAYVPMNAVSEEMKIVLVLE